MKQLPRIAAALYGTPWSILPEAHAELGMLYRGYVKGELPTLESITRELPQGLDSGARVSSGISYIADHSQGIAIIYLEGIISKRAPDMLCGPAIVDLARLDSLLDEIAADDAIETVVMDWNSPGGMVIGLEETAERIREIAAEKRVIAYSDFQCCSAAYYLACAADEIYSAPTAIIGSIGTYCAGLDDSRQWEMEGMELVLAKSGNLKAMGHPGKPWTEEEKLHLQGKADVAGSEFRAWVQSRRPGVEQSSMEGQWFHAKQDPGGIIDGFYRDLPALLADLMQEV